MGETKAGDGYNMEEILSSIRKMIIEQDEKLNKIENSEDNKKLDNIANNKSYSDTKNISEDVLELTDEVNESGELIRKIISDKADIFESINDSDKILIDEGKKRSNEAGYLLNELKRIVNDAEKKLCSTNNHTQTLEYHVRDMLRPMLKDWLEKNLPNMVEEIVKREIISIAESSKLSD